MTGKANSPTQPWSVVLTQDEETLEIIIEGYGADLTNPIETRRVYLKTIAGQQKDE